MNNEWTNTLVSAASTDQDNPTTESASQPALVLTSDELAQLPSWAEAFLTAAGDGDLLGATAALPAWLRSDLTRLARGEDGNTILAGRIAAMNAETSSD